MNLNEAILALLKAAFSGVREDGLRHLAAAIGLQVTTEEEAKEVVGKLTADAVSKYVQDWRSGADAEIAKANKTYEDGLKKKYDFVERTQQTPPAPPTQTPPEGLTLDAISKLIDSKLSGVQNSITALAGERTAAARRDQFIKKLTDAKVDQASHAMMLRNFDRISPTLTSEEEFNAYLTEADSDIAAIVKERADRGLSGHDKPLFGAVNEKGVSSAVSDFIKERSESGTALTGKEV